MTRPATLIQAVATQLRSDSTLTAMLTGGIYVTRQAFDIHKAMRDAGSYLLPFAIVTDATIVKPANTYARGRNQVAYLDVYIYDDENHSYTADSGGNPVLITDSTIITGDPTILLHRSAQRTFDLLVNTTPAESDEYITSFATMVSMGGLPASIDIGFHANRIIQHYQTAVAVRLTS